MKQNHKKNPKMNQNQAGRGQSRSGEPLKKGIDYGKKRFHIIDPRMVCMIAAVFVVTGALAAISNAYGFDKKWYGDILTTVDCVIAFFALLDIGYLLLDGFTVEDGTAFLGVDSEKKPISFAARSVRRIYLENMDGEEVAEEQRVYHGVKICFALADGVFRCYKAGRLSHKTYRDICTYFEV